MHTLHVPLLGNFRVIYGDEPVAGFATPRLQSVLAYFLLHRQARQARHHVAFVLWPASTESQARTNLRKHLYHFGGHCLTPSAFCVSTGTASSGGRMPRLRSTSPNSNTRSVSPSRLKKPATLSPRRLRLRKASSSIKAICYPAATMTGSCLSANGYRARTYGPWTN